MAIKELDRALALDANISDAHNTYARALLDLGRTGEALIEIQGALRLDPQSTEAYRSRADLYTELGEYELAKSDKYRSMLLA